MRKKATSIDIANSLGLSQSTVSRVLNQGNTHKVSERTRERVLSAAREKGYVPNLRARALSTGRTNVVALALPELKTPFFGWLADAAIRQLHPMGYEVILQIGVREEYPAESQELTVSPVDAAIGWTGSLEYGLLGAVIREFAIPAVHIGIEPYVPKNGDTVMVDLAPAVRLAIGSLMESGRKRICFLTNRWPHLYVDARELVYVEMMNEAGRNPEIVVSDSIDKPTLCETAFDHLSLHPEVDALFCVNDHEALAAYSAIRRLGRRIPDDVAVIGCDGIDDGEVAEPPLSTIAQPVDEVVSRACRLLGERLDNPDSPLINEVIPAVFMPKGSS